ncbi:substrate-binding domain-containing protein [Sulfitobacter sp.]|uniref:substrate-binding domain-containing protein n=1 Tax=Sulfitobacter sp. TaxID=1903071 RepID=UPI003003860F
MPAGANTFFQHVRAIINHKVEAASLSSISIEIQDVPAFDAKRLAEHLGELAKSELDGLAVVGLEGDALLAPLLALKKNRIPVVSLVSALPSLEESTYIGIHNVVAGRTAARLVGMAHGGGRAVFSSSSVR